MPFVTEEIWSNICKDKGEICIQPWPEVKRDVIDWDAEKNMQTILYT